MATRTPKIQTQLGRSGVSIFRANERMNQLLLEHLDGKAWRAKPPGNARTPWPVGIEMLCYMLAHEAHHRGQVCMLAHQLGFKLPNKVTSGMWNWEKLWRMPH